ncbi:MAG: hypothetical protein EXR55_02505 [Dehalococcoidia bacterium]|nr:hypothetical protein [Dehalococcoidia bacterium]
MLKDRHEMGALDGFFAWLEPTKGRRLSVRAKREAPDFECVDEAENVVGVEITSPPYNQQAAEAAWSQARGESTRLDGVFKNPDQQLAKSVNQQLIKKCNKRYEVNYPVILVVDVLQPRLTSEEEFETTVVPQINVPERPPFLEIYVGGLLRHVRPSGDEEWRYWYWLVYPVE